MTVNTLQTGVSVKSRVPIQPLASVPLIVNEAVVVLVGVPVSTPVLASVKPVGSAPELTLHVTVPLLPAAVNVTL